MMMKPQKGKAPNRYPTERRVALENRRRVSEMTTEEMRRELLMSQVTGLPNRRAFDEAGPAPATAMADMDGLKALNRYGYEVGNAVLRAMAHSLRQVGLEAYHDKGDEFLCRGYNLDELIAKLEDARCILRHHAAIVAQPDGSRLNVRGADFSYGVGKNIEEAEWVLRRNKAERECKGEIVRGELRAITLSLCNPEDLSAGLQKSPLPG